MTYGLAVVDNSVVIQSIQCANSPDLQVMERGYKGDFRFAISRRLMEELSNTCYKKLHLRKEVASVVMNSIRAAATLFADPPHKSTDDCDDPDDLFLVALARASKALALVANDKKVLKSSAANCCTPPDFLRILNATCAQSPSAAT